jgi:hypothetical protein
MAIKNGWPTLFNEFVTQKCYESKRPAKNERKSSKLFIALQLLQLRIIKAQNHPHHDTCTNIFFSCIYVLLTVFTCMLVPNIKPFLFPPGLDTPAIFST